MPVRKKKKSKIVKARVSDEELIRRLEDDAAHVLRATISEAVFDEAVEGLLKESPRQKKSAKD